MGRWATDRPPRDLTYVQQAETDTFTQRQACSDKDQGSVADQLRGAPALDIQVRYTYSYTIAAIVNRLMNFQVLQGIALPPEFGAKPTKTGER